MVPAAAPKKTAPPSRSAVEGNELEYSGGSFSSKRSDGSARHPVAQFQYDMATKNVFDNAVVIVDEVHNLVAHFESPKLKVLPRQLMTATNLTLVGLLSAFGWNLVKGWVLWKHTNKQYDTYMPSSRNTKYKNNQKNKYIIYLYNCV